MYLLYYPLNHYSSVFSLLMEVKFAVTQCDTNSSLIYLALSVYLTASCLVLDLTSCCVIDFVWPECTVLVKCTFVCSHVLGLDIHSHSLTDPSRAASGPAGSIHGQCPMQWTTFSLLYHIFTVPFLCLYV